MADEQASGANDNAVEQKRTFWEEWRGFIIFVAVMFFFRIAIADWNHVPSGSMRPTLIEGDRIWVNKLAYDVKIPFTDVSLKTVSDPKRGDIIVFYSPADGTRLVKRIIGIPGDTISYRNQQLYLNGQPVRYSELEFDGLDESLSYEQRQGYDFLVEQLPDRPHPVIHSPRQVQRQLSEVTIPPDEYIALGDNRDNSKDSRYWGQLHRDHIIGRTSSVVLSFNRNNYYLPRSSRWFRSLP